MVQYRRIGYVLLALGFVLCAVPFVFAGGTQRLCQIDSVVYDTIGIQPAGFAVTGIDLATFELLWYDGCNWRSGPLIPLVLGIGSVISGITAIGWAARESANSSG